MIAWVALALLAKEPVTVEAVAQYRPAPGIRAVWSPQGGEFLYTESAKLRVYSVATRTSRELLEMSKLEGAAKEPPPAPRFDWQNRGVVEQPIQWMPDGKRVLLQVKGDLFLLEVATQKWEQLTATAEAERDPKPSPDGRLVGYRKSGELYLLDVASRKEKRLTTDASATRRNGELDWVYPEELALSTAWWWAPDSSRIAYLQFDVSPIAEYPQAELLRLEAYAEPERYPKAGTPNSLVRLGVVRTEGGKTRWVEAGVTKDHLLARVAWVPGTGELFLQRLNRVQNRLDVLLASSVTGEARVLFSETDPHWVNIGDGPVFLADGKEFLWTSERSGFKHLYRVALAGGEPKPLTSGDFEVTFAGVDQKAGVVFFTSTEVSPRERHLYSVRLDGSGKRRLSGQAGWTAAQFAPHGGAHLVTHSSTQEPPRIALCDGEGRELAVLRDRDRTALERYDLRPVEFVDVKAPDGTTLHAQLIRPPNFDPAKKYPAIVQVYGGPHSQTVRNLWTGVNMAQAMAARGFVVWGLDNRGMAGRGHAFESKLYRRLGKQELDDQKAGVAHLLSLGFVDPKRVGITGWSYGGFMTLYSLLYAPEVFAAGVSGAPVTDWRNYDTIYTERYLGLPQENETGYRDSSPVHAAANLKGKLLLLHNFSDDNVLFQNTFQMANALQQAGKPFEMMVYPQKSHGVSGKASQHLNAMLLDFFARTLRVE